MHAIYTYMYTVEGTGGFGISNSARSVRVVEVIQSHGEHVAVYDRDSRNPHCRACARERSSGVDFYRGSHISRLTPTRDTREITEFRLYIFFSTSSDRKCLILIL